MNVVIALCLVCMLAIVVGVIVRLFLLNRIQISTTKTHFRRLNSQNVRYQHTRFQPWRINFSGGKLTRRFYHYAF